MQKNRRAFLVEDNEQLCEALKDALRALSSINVVDSVDSESDALNWLALYSDNVDVVILDMFLTSGTGYSILKQMRDAELLHPIVVLTNGGSQLLKEKCLAAGATAFFDKANEQNEFFEYLKNLVFIC